MSNRVLLLLSIILLFGGSACQSLRQSMQGGGELPVNESGERVNLMGKPAETKPEKPRPEKSVKAPSEAPAPSRGKAAKAEKKKKDEKHKKAKKTRAERRREKRGKTVQAQSSTQQAGASGKKSSELLFSEDQGLGYANREIEAVIKTAETYLGVPYRWGGMSRAGVDCSGLMVLAFQSAGMTIPRVSGDQYAKGKPVKRAELRPGDLLFFSAGRPGVIGHTALVVAVKGGSVKFIHATSGHGVRYDYLESEHWGKLYMSASRYL